MLVNYLILNFSEVELHLVTFFGQWKSCWLLVLNEKHRMIIEFRTLKVCQHEQEALLQVNNIQLCYSFKLYITDLRFLLY